MQQRKVTIRDIGPISEFTFAVPEKGGVVVLKGVNGIGKTRALEAVNALTTGNGKVDHRDGAVRGEVSGFGATLKVARRQTTAGELEVTSLEGRFSVLDLVDPKLKAADAADAKRIKALVRLTGSNADPALFYKVIGSKEEFERYVSSRTTGTDDLVTMAARVKADFEDHARKIKDAAEKEVIEAKAARALAGEIDLTLPDDAAKLHEDLVLALQEESRLKEQARAALSAQYAAEEAGKALKHAEDNYSGPGVGVARAQVETATNEEAAAKALVEDLERKLRAAKQDLTHKEAVHATTKETLATAESHEATIAAWREQLGKQLPEGPTDEQIRDATADVVAAQEAIDRGTLVREAKKRIGEADAHMTSAAELHREADRLRSAAQGTDGILSEVVQKLGCPLKVAHGGRLVLATDRSNEELFADLSRGEQWKVALDIAIDAVGPQGVIVVDQEGWEGIDPGNRTLIAEHLAGTGVVLITAECDLGELRAEQLVA